VNSVQLAKSRSPSRVRQLQQTNILQQAGSYFEGKEPLCTLFWFERPTRSSFGQLHHYKAIQASRLHRLISQQDLTSCTILLPRRISCSFASYTWQPGAAESLSIAFLHLIASQIIWEKHGLTSCDPKQDMVVFPAHRDLHLSTLMHNK
jgi:hypothetical protein